jgi:hypothetical protein
LSHKPEQQFSWLVQLLPAVRQPGLSGRHVPPLPLAPSQRPPQHSPSVVQAWLSETQVVAPHRLPSQTPVQHSVGAAQLAPAVLQVPTGVAQVFESGSQLAEQQSLWVSQLSPTAAS